MRSTKSWDAQESPRVERQAVERPTLAHKVGTTSTPPRFRDSPIEPDTRTLVGSMRPTVREENALDGVLRIRRPRLGAVQPAGAVRRISNQVFAVSSLDRQLCLNAGACRVNFFLRRVTDLGEYPSGKWPFSSPAPPATESDSRQT